MSYIDVVEYKNKIHCWDRDADGNLSYTQHDSPHHLYMRDNTGEGLFKDIYGHPMKKIEFPDQRKLSEFASSRKDIVAESDVRPAYRFLIDHYTEADTNAPYNVSLFDIEVDFDLSEGKGYPSPKNPFGEINAFSIYDSMYDSYIMLIPRHLKGKVSLSDEREGKHVEVVWTNNERDMLKTFSSYLDHVDITSAWNGDGFDWPYIMERAIILFGEKKAKTMFSRDDVPAKRRDFVNDFGEEVWEWSFPGRPHLDMMKLFKKFHPGEKKSFKLDSICEGELGEKKVAYTGDLGGLYREDPQTFFEYSLHDSRLLTLLNDKKKIIDLGMLMVRDMCSLTKDIFGSVNIINMAIMKFCRLNGNVILPDMPMMDKEEFPGAIVFDTLPGRHTWVFTSDVTAMYPSVIMALGMSLENLLFHLEGDYEDYIKVMTRSDDVVRVVERDGTESDARAYEIHDLIKENGWTISGYGVVFDGSMGIIASFLEVAQAKRNEYKAKMKKAEYGSSEYQLYDLHQKVMKITSNSVYGVLAQPAFRLASIRLAASTTTTGQLMGKQQAYVANKKLEEAINGKERP